MNKIPTLSSKIMSYRFSNYDLDTHLYSLAN